MLRIDNIIPFALPEVPDVKQIIARESGAEGGKLTIEGLEGLDALVSLVSLDALDELDELDALDALEAIMDVPDARDSKFSREMIFSTCGIG